MRPSFLAATIAVCWYVNPPIAGFSADISYVRQVQPILAEHCLACHGNDAEHREADLRLDDEASAKAHAIVAGAPDRSPLIERITSTDPDLRMPPGTAPRLTASEIQVLQAWIASGANYERHWSFEPIADPAPPAEAGAASDIDRFIVAKLSANNLSLSAPATKQQLIRRATFDLTGLPPTWEEVTAFINDDSPQAFAKVVDRLLESPAYGERWGRHWLDIARYADTLGGAAIGFTRFPFSYTYRDYVLQAFNDDLPYDQFVTEQLAADQLDLPANAKQLAALGFLTVGMQFRSPHDTLDDQIDVITRGLMGLTVSCARCHDHKFDAIPTSDYYAIYATLASSHEPEVLPLAGEPSPSPELTAYEAQLNDLQTAYTDMARDQNEVMRARLRMQVGLYMSEIAKGIREIDLSTTNIFSYRTDDVRPPVLEQWRRYLIKMPVDDPVFGPWVKLREASEEQFAEQCTALLATLKSENGEVTTDWHRVASTAPRWNPRVIEAIERKQPTSLLDVADAYGELFIEVQREWLTAQLEAALEAAPNAKPIPDEDARHLIVNSPVNRQLRRHLYGPDTPTNMDDDAAAKLLNRPIHDNLAGRKGAIHNLNLNAPGSPPRAMALREQADTDPFYVFNRGNPIDRGPRVEARFLTALTPASHTPFEPGKRRLSLARAIVNPDNPLTRRVIVNWVWQRHFGQGLVRTPDDFGTRGERPTHPELLDYLASRLLEDNWSLKALHRRIMLTNVYQQGAVESPRDRE
ncbi:MAG: PSD1 domain-containing protein, partial [Planctomycetales bacterium]|nr:PSD1 domain-containing protein [Planctomycetales bacterium]